jgi:hypothetical protein
VRLHDIVCGRPLGVTILAVVKTVLGASWNTERRTKAIALYVGTAAKWAGIKFHVTHVPGSAMFGVEAAAESIDGFRQPPVDFAPIYALTQFNAARYKTQKPCFLPNYPPTAKLISHAV